MCFWLAVISIVEFALETVWGVRFPPERLTQMGRHETSCMGDLVRAVYCESWTAVFLLIPSTFFFADIGGS